MCSILFRGFENAETVAGRPGGRIPGTWRCQRRDPGVFGAALIPVDGPEIADGILLIDDGTVLAVGPRGEVDVPDDAEVIELEAGSFIMPGIVDSHIHVGEVSGANRSASIQPEARALDSVNIRSSSIKPALAGGITLAPVRMLGIADRVGSLEIAKHGDLALFDGDPLEYTSHVIGTVPFGNIAPTTPKSRPIRRTLEN